LTLERLFIKRDDLASTRYDGSKVRNLEFPLAEAVPNGMVVTSNGVGSDPAAALAAFGHDRESSR
jgi:1-aminocyclopropane-1-carboxylate deaminase/D-cysteine desulfhydrase-like pyridoxal-dependent ACC family enzyme